MNPAVLWTVARQILIPGPLSFGCHLCMSYESRAQIVVTRRGLTLELASHQWRAIGDAFARDHHVFLRGFLGDDVLSILHTRLARGAFRKRVEDGREIERTLDDPALVALYLVAL